MPLEKRKFTTGVDSDSTQEDVIPTSARYHLNIRSMSSDGQNEGAITNVKGNTLVTMPLNIGVNKCVGSYEYKQLNKIYFFVWNSVGSHTIYEYDESSNVVSIVLRNSILNFNRDYLITGINVAELNLTNHLLYWTDDNNEPKKINIEKGKLHSSGNFIQGYPTPFLAEYIYRIKAPELHPPTCAYGSDTNRNVNLLTGHLFQFATQYIYDDFERSAKSPISIPPLPALVCSSNPAPNSNNNIAVTVETGSEIVTKILILAREGNTGDFFKIITLDKSLLGIPSNSTYTYNFYNDEVYNFVDINEAIKLFDNVPLKSKAQELIEGERIVDGNILEGFDGVNVNAKLDLAILPDPSPRLYGFSGKIYIGNFFVNDPEFQYGQPIHSPTGNVGDIVFGGCGKGVNDITIVNGIASDYGQTIPLAGFVVYLAGTPYYAISQQSMPSNITAYVGNTSAYNSDSGNFRQAHIQSAINAKDVYSVFNFSGVPPGKYIMRIASHLTTQADLGGGNLDWQKSSTNTSNVAGDNNTECAIEITTNGTIITSAITTNTYPFEIAPSFIMDLTDPRQASASTALTGYVTDKDITSPQPNTGAYLADTRIELSKVIFSGGGVAGLNNPFATFNAAGLGFVIGNAINPISDYAMIPSASFTDHNGYFYFTKQQGFANLSVSKVFSGAADLGVSQYQYANPPALLTPFNNSAMKMGIFRTNTGVTTFSRTIFNGNVKYNGNGVSGVSAMTTQGGVVTSLSNGQFELPVYVNTRITPLRSGYVLYAVSDNCVATFSPTSDYYSIAISNTAAPQTVFASPYNGTYDYTLPNQLLLSQATILTILGAGSSVSLKRGSVEQFGIVYYDHGNRSGLTNTNDAKFDIAQSSNQGYYGNKLTIPFFTDIDPTTSAIYGGAQPVVSWSIYHRPPEWATHYQWVRTLNSVPNRYLQFTAKGITYTDDSRVTVPYTQATLIGINIQNIANYANLHGDSVLNFGTNATNNAVFVPEIGDRIRFIKDSNGNFFNSYVDLKIVNVDPAGIAYVNNDFTLGQISAGCLFELYTPKLQSPTQIYYEIGECYDIGDAGLATRYHKGQTQNQNTLYVSVAPFNVPQSTIPATGTFSSGDTYWKTRSIPFGVVGSPPDPTKFASIKSWYVEDANFSDFFSSKVQNIGRPNKVDRTYRQVRRKSTIYYSEKFVPETQINGLSSVYDTSFQTYEAQYGSIQKLFNYNLRLDCYQELKTGAIPINQVQMQSTAPQGADVVGTTSNVLNPIRYYAGEFGIGLNPESFAYYGGARYFFDLKRGAVLRLANDGITPIDDYRKNNYFTQKSKDIMATGIRPNVYGTFDVRFSEYVMAFETNSTVVNETLAFNEKRNAWNDFYAYIPEGMCTNGVDIVSFKDGNLYTHNSNPVYNNFYGVQSVSEVWVVINGIPSKEKVLQAISLECADVWEAYEVTTPNGQLSNLIASDFVKKQNMWYGAVLRDQNTPNVTNPLFEGDILVDTSFLVKLRNSSTTEVKMYACNGYWSEQERSNR